MIPIVTGFATAYAEVNAEQAQKVEDNVSKYLSREIFIWRNVHVISHYIKSFRVTSPSFAGMGMLMGAVCQHVFALSPHCLVTSQCIYSLDRLENSS